MNNSSPIWAKTILRSRNLSGPQPILSTLLLRMPRIILAEFNTHRAFSRNAASSRAIPVEKIISQVENDPFIPLSWGKNQKGMQAGEEHDVPVDFPTGVVGVRGSASKEDAWMIARDNAVSSARGFAKAGFHKQIINRLLEPFMWTLVLVSSTEWSNFLTLRDHPAAEPHMQLLAKAIRLELERTDNIQDLIPGQWHLPFSDLDEGDFLGLPIPFQQTLSVARCASTSWRAQPEKVPAPRGCLMPGLSIRLTDRIILTFEAGHVVELPDTEKGWKQLRSLLRMREHAADRRIAQPAAPTQGQLKSILAAWDKSEDWLEMNLEELQ